MTRHLLRRQEGSALITAMLVMMLCLMVGFTAMAMIDVQQGQSRGERERESSFALGEGALNAQIFMLSEAGRTAQPSRTRRVHAGHSERPLPDPTTLNKSFTGADYDAGQKWSTAVHDNAPESAQDEERDQF